MTKVGWLTDRNESHVFIEIYAVKATWNQHLNGNLSIMGECGLILEKTRPDTRLSQSRAGGQGPYLR